MFMTPQCACNKWIWKTLDPGKAITLFDGVQSSYNLTKELITLVLTMTLSIISFILGICFSTPRLYFKKDLFQ